MNLDQVALLDSLPVMSLRLVVFSQCSEIFGFLSLLEVIDAALRLTSARLVTVELSLVKDATALASMGSSRRGKAVRRRP